MQKNKEDFEKNNKIFYIFKFFEKFQEYLLVMSI